MGTTSEKLSYLNTTKGKIKDSINLTGANLTTEPFRQYSTKLEDAYVDIINNGTDTLYSNFPKVTGEGTSLTLNNTYEAPMRNTLKGNTSQTGTPTPSSPIPVNVVSGDNEISVCGKNLLITKGWQNATISPDGSLNYGSDRLVSGYIPITSGTTKMVLSVNISLDFLGIAYYDEEKQYIDRNKTNDNNKVVGTIPNNTKFVRVFINRGYTTMTINSFADYEVQIEYGENETTYEAPINNTYNIDLPVENLANVTILNQVPSISNGQLTSLSGGACTDMIEIDNTINYILSTTVSSSATPYVAFYDSNSSYLGTKQAKDSSSSGYLLNTSEYYSNCNYIRLRFDEYAKYLTIQLEKGSKANSYTPYGTTPIEMCKIGNYQDYFYKDSDKWYLHKEIGKVVLNGSEGVTLNTNAQNSFYVPITNLKYDNYKLNVMSNCFKGIPWGDRVTGGNNTCYSESGNKITIRNTSYSSVSDFTSYLSTNQPILEYVLATPTNTEITYQPLIDQLNLLEKAQSKENQTNISQINNDLPFIISASALKKG